MALINNTNTTFSNVVPDGIPQSLLTTSAVFLCCHTIVSTIINFICFALFIRNRELLANPSNKFAFNFVISSFSSSFLLIPTTFASIVAKEWLLKDMMCQIIGMLSVTLPVAELLTLASIAYDRHHFIVNGLTYPINMTSFKVNVIVFFTWFIAIISGLMPLFGWGTYAFNPDAMTCTVTWRGTPSFGLYFFGISYLMPLLTQAYCYFGIIRVAKKQAKFGRRLSRVAVIPLQVARIIRETSAAKTIKKTFIVMGIFILAWTSNMIMILVQGLSDAASTKVPFFVTNVLTYVPLLAYPLLFVFRSKHLKQEVRLLFRSLKILDCVNSVSPMDIDDSDQKERRRSSLSLEGYDLGARRRSSRVSWAMPVVVEDGVEPSREPRPSLTASTITTDVSSLQGTSLLPGEVEYGYKNADKNMKNIRILR